MTDEDLRTLLRERVEDVTTTDLSVTAWSAGRRIRARRRLGAVVGVAAATLVVAGVAVAVGGQSATDSDPGPSTSSPTVDEPDATVQGAGVFWSPDPTEEDDLPPAEDGGVLPTSIDLAPGAPSVEGAPITRVDAAFAVYDAERLDRVLLLTADGYRSLELSAEEWLTSFALSADGRSLHVSDPDGVARTYSFTTGEWVGERVADGPTQEVPPQVVEADAYGATRSDPAGTRTAQAYGWGSRVPAAPGGRPRPETVVVAPTLGPPTILALTDPGGDRYNQCCPVSGWLDDDTVVYESRSSDPKLLAWGVGTHDFSLLSRIDGLGTDESYAATFADLSGSAQVGEEAEGGEEDADADATSQGVPVWWSPDLAQELELPWIDEGASELPREIDATADAPDLADDPIDRAVAAFAPDSPRPASVVLLAPDGGLRALDISTLSPFDDSDGNASAVATATMLSPDGSHLVFAQRGHVMVYALASGDWTRIETGDATTDFVAWADDETLYLPPGPAGGRGPVLDLAGERVGTDDLAPPEKAFDIARAFDNAEGPWRTNHTGDAAQSWGMGGPFLPVRDPETYLSGPAYLSVVGPSGTRALAFMTAVDDPRFLDAPQVAGWLDDDTVVYESRADDRDLLVAWDVATHTFRRVAAIAGAGVASFADLQQR